MVPTISLGWELDVQQSLFKLKMKSNYAQAMVEIMTLAFDKANLTIINVLTKIWSSMHHICCLIHLQSMSSFQRLLWFTFWVLLKSNPILV
jgi:hypothetical protein